MARTVELAPTPNNRLLYKKKEAAARVALSITALDRLVKSGLCSPSIRRGNFIRYTEDDLQELLNNLKNSGK